MMLFLLANWKWLGATAATLALCITFHNLRVNQLENDWATQKRDAVAAANKQCLLDKVALTQTLEQSCKDEEKVTEDANNGYQTQVGAITVKLNSLRAYANRCVALSSDTGPSQLPASGPGYAGRDGLSVGRLREYAAECNTYRAQRITTDQYNAAVKALKTGVLNTTQ